MGVPQKKQIDGKVLWLVVATDGRFFWTTRVCDDQLQAEQEVTARRGMGGTDRFGYLVVRLDCFDRVDPSALKSLGAF